MDHVAIMKKSWGLTEKILSGQKKIESRWYKNKCRPWGIIKPGDRVYFKNSGESVMVEAKVRKVLQFENLSPKKVRDILDKYGEADGIERTEMLKFAKMFKDKKYCILIFLKNPVPIKPFVIDKTGFGAMSAWVSVGNINNIKKDK
ncbi:MAG: ASCH domain-containing protein [Candidatus Paceibacterota bacterium]|jgi:ASC-1-like (ASCH) protein